ncbi:MAG: hypothetical protein AAFV45_04260 [Pseudomonadota bacterium]
MALVVLSATGILAFTHGNDRQLPFPNQVREHSWASWNSINQVFSSGGWSVVGGAGSGLNTLKQRNMFLARSTLIALDHAIRTGNYTVLHHLSDPVFQRQNPPEKLASIFGSLRKSGVDLTFAAVQPLSLEPTILRKTGEPLRISGQFATNTSPVKFDMRFKVRNGLWRLIGIVVAPDTQQHARLTREES